MFRIEVVFRNSIFISFHFHLFSSNNFFHWIVSRMFDNWLQRINLYFVGCLLHTLYIVHFIRHFVGMKSKIFQRFHNKQLFAKCKNAEMVKFRWISIPFSIGLIWVFFITNDKWNDLLWLNIIAGLLCRAVFYEMIWIICETHFRSFIETEYFK